MDRQPSRNPAFGVVLPVVGVPATVAITVAFDPPTSVFLLVLAAAFAHLSAYSSRPGRR